MPTKFLIENILTSTYFLDSGEVSFHICLIVSVVSSQESRAVII